MTFQQLQYLLEVSRTGSISGAAKNLYLAQSSVSAAISTLEEELGFPVFLRSKKGVVPTAEGQQVIEQAARICESYRVMTKADSSGCRHICICAPSYAPLDQAFVRLVAQYQNSTGVRFSADTCNTIDAARKLSTFELDGAVLLNHEARTLAVQSLFERKGLQLRTLATVPVVVQLGPNHPLYNKDQISPTDLDGMLFADDIQDPLVQNEYLKGILRLRPENTVAFKHDSTRKMLVAQGLAYSIGVGLSPQETEALALRTVPLEGVSYSLLWATNPNSRPCPELDTYITYLMQAFHK